MKALIVGEHAGGNLRKATLAAMQMGASLAEESQGSWQCLLLGPGCLAAAQEASLHGPTWTLDDPGLDPATADSLAPAIARVVREHAFDAVVAAATSWGKDVLGRAAGLLGGAFASDVIAHEFVGGELRLQRPMYAGTVRATVRLHGGPKIITVRASSYSAAPRAASAAPVTSCPVTLDSGHQRVRVEGIRSKQGGRKDVTEARIVVSGGRAWKSTEDFEGHVGRLADLLGGAAGSSRVLVDAGITSNEIQVGQTGKIVAPDLYMALGISGAMQHLAGMRNSKLIVAINEDPDAPIFQVSDFALVGDVYELVPQLIAQLESPSVRRSGASGEA
jgi:electron transfer flavoprotein alpha subunit